MADERPPDDPLPHDQRRARRPQAQAPLRRSGDRVVAGVAGGIARFVGTDPATVRWMFGASLILTIGLSGVVYLLLWVLLPGPGNAGNPGP